MTPRAESLALLSYLACLFWVRLSFIYSKNVALFGLNLKILTSVRFWG